jgi:NADH dehydrogenase
MPVVVTGASGFIGARAVLAFSRIAPEVRAFVRDRQGAAPLRELGAKVAVGEIGDVDRLEVVMAGAHTVCHLVGGLTLPAGMDYESRVVGTLGSVLEAACRAGVERILYLSYPGASAVASNPYLRAKGRAERAIADSGIEHVVIRSTHVYGPGGSWVAALRKQAFARSAVVVGNGRQVLAPVFVDDVAAVLASADDRDRVTSGTWGLEGPDRLTADEMIDRLAGRARRKLHVSPRMAALVGRATGSAYGLPLLEVLESDSVADAPDAAAEFGVERTSLDEGLRRTF